MKLVKATHGGVEQELKTCTYQARAMLSNLVHQEFLFDIWYNLNVWMRAHPERWNYCRRIDVGDLIMLPSPTALYRQWPDGDVEMAKPQSDIWPVA